MSSIFSIIVTNQVDIKMPKEIPHFYKNGFLGIPLESFAGYEIGKLIDQVIKTEDHDIESYTDFNFIKLMLVHKIRTFKAWYWSDFGGVPDNYYEFSVKDGQILINSIRSTDIHFPESYVNQFENLYLDKLDGEEIDDYFYSFRDYSSFLAEHTRRDL